jgi:hypothetical protein
MISIPLITKTFNGLNIFSVEVGSNYPCGGDSGHGGRTVLRFVNHSSTDMRVRVDELAFENTQSIELVVGGDAEHEFLIEALEFAVTTLKTLPHTDRKIAQVE